MNEININPHPFIYPKPVVLTGAFLGGKLNFFTVEDITSSGYETPRIVVSSAKVHYTNQGIMKNNEFSVNIPSEDMVDVKDYCGITQGKRNDKSILFEAFDGGLKNSPLINAAPVNTGIN